MRPFVDESVRRALPCWLDTDYSFCLITFKLHMPIVDEERRNPIDFGSKVQVNFGILLYKTFRARNKLQFLHNHFLASREECPGS